MANAPSAFLCEHPEMPLHVMVEPAQKDCEDGHHFCGICTASCQLRCLICNQRTVIQHHDTAVEREIAAWALTANPCNQDLIIFNLRSRHIKCVWSRYLLSMEIKRLVLNINKFENSRGVGKSRLEPLEFPVFSSSPVEADALKKETRYLEGEIVKLQQEKKKLESYKESLQH